MNKIIFEDLLKLGMQTLQTKIVPKQKKFFKRSLSFKIKMKRDSNEGL